MTDMQPAADRAHQPRRLGVGIRSTGWIAAVALVLAPLAPAAAFGATTTATTTATPSPTPTTVGEVVLTAAPTGSGVVPTGQDPVFAVHVDNSTPRPLPAAPVVVTLSRTPLASSVDVAGWLDDTDADPTGATVFDEIARVDAAELSADDERTTNVSVSAEASGIAALAPGVYPVRIATAGEVSRTVITVPAPDAPSRPIGVVVPVTAGPLTGGLLTAERLSELTSEDGALTAALEAVTGTSAILAVDPAVPAAIRVLGTSAPDSAQAWLDALSALPNERFALQFGDADLATQVHAGLPAPLTPTTLAPYADESDFADATPPTIPALTDLLSIGTADPAVFWPASGTAGADVVTTIDAQAGPDAAALVLVPDTTVDAAPGVVRAAHDAADLLVYDRDISAELAAAADAADATARGTHLAAAAAHVSLSGTGALLTVVDRPVEPTRASLRAAIATATGSPGATPLSLADLQAAPAAAVTVADIPPVPERVEALTGFLASEADLAVFATVLLEPAQLTARERASILQVMGNAWLTDAAAWAAAVADHAQGTRVTLGAVGIANPGTINFLATSAPISVTVRNDLPWPVSATLVAHTDDPRLIVESSTVVEAGAEQNTRVEVPVEARVGSGDTTLELQLWSATMVPIGPSETIAVTVRAEWESVGLVIVIIIVIVLFAGGVVRTVLKLRRRRAAHGAVSAPASDAATEPDRA